MTKEKIRQIILETVDILEDADLTDEIELFGNGIGLDSIDAIDIGIRIRDEFGIDFETDMKKNRKIFRNVKSLTEYVDGKRKKDDGNNAE